MKRCSKCAERKPFSEFHLDRRPNGDGYQRYCKACCSASVMASRERNYMDYKQYRTLYHTRKKLERSVHTLEVLRAC